MVIRMEISRITTEAPGRREICLGLLYGVCGLIGVAIFLSVADPYLRDPDGAVFSLSRLVNNPNK
jgi:hypothetical protein